MRTLDIEAQVREGVWEPLGRHACTTDDEVRAYVERFQNSGPNYGKHRSPRPFLRVVQREEGAP